ncbi:MAG: hypothetical protein J6A63_10700 [Clostridia bacterium]|nr:hypothetical protein [Clostridia bacterium]
MYGLFDIVDKEVFGGIKPVVFRPLAGFSSLISKTKNTPQGVLFVLVDDQGAFATLKENPWFSDPLQGSRP